MGYVNIDKSGLERVLGMGNGKIFLNENGEIFLNENWEILFNQDGEKFTLKNVKF